MTPPARRSLTFRATGDELLALTHAGLPFYKPPWSPTIVGMVLDDDTDWSEVAELVTESLPVPARRRSWCGSWTTSPPDPDDRQRVEVGLPKGTEMHMMVWILLAAAVVAARRHVRVLAATSPACADNGLSHIDDLDLILLGLPASGITGSRDADSDVPALRQESLQRRWETAQWIG